MLYEKHPQLTARLWIPWSYLTTTILTLGSIAAKCPRSSLGPSALAQFGSTLQFFADSAAQGPRSTRALNLFYRFKLRVGEYTAQLTMGVIPPLLPVTDGMDAVLSGKYKEGARVVKMEEVEPTMKHWDTVEKEKRKGKSSPERDNETSPEIRNPQPETLVPQFNAPQSSFVSSWTQPPYTPLPMANDVNININLDISRTMFYPEDPRRTWGGIDASGYVSQYQNVEGESRWDATGQGWEYMQASLQQPGYHHPLDVPAAASVANPVDLNATMNPGIYTGGDTTLGWDQLEELFQLPQVHPYQS